MPGSGWRSTPSLSMTARYSSGGIPYTTSVVATVMSGRPVLIHSIVKTVCHCGSERHRWSVAHLLEAQNFKNVPVALDRAALGQRDSSLLLTRTSFLRWGAVAQG